MTTISAAPARIRSAGPSAPPRVVRRPVPLVDWEATSDGSWRGRIGVDRAGSIDLADGGFRLRDWDGADLGIWPTLDEAQRHLEPEVRAADRAAAERRSPVRGLAPGLLVSAATASVLVSTGWVALHPW